ncbi:hypothetical protein [Peristeroidobacter agariperforans]|uniref:hypothetical protein n=1 Tax=Peristeroidobacter agariperforans TaxID=268404 RepID=UPI00101B9A0E|nr:hypothetical protein [Peristeroidobacter agariperforans]
MTIRNKAMSCSLALGLIALGTVGIAGAATPDLSGFWELKHDSKKVTPAEVTAEGKRLAEANRPKVEDGMIMTYASRWCHPLGTPFIMGDSAPLDLIQSKKELAITAEVQSSARHIYLDGRPHPDRDAFDPTTNGHSIGRWEGDVLVVDTVGFNDRGNPMVPGGGVRGESSHLLERYELIDGGERLKVTFTWTDPKIFVKPHTYSFTYYKAAPETYALEYFCDSSDPERAKTAEEPPQIQSKE